MAVTLYIPQPFTMKRYLESLEHPGRPSKSVAGGWVADMASTGKAIMLCAFCVHKFNPRASGYEVWRNDVYSVAKCDDCKQFSRQIRTFIPQSQHVRLGEWMRHKPKKGRWFLNRSGR